MRCALFAFALLAWTTPATAQTADSLPPGVTADVIADGKKMFNGPGVCSACHGPQAKGIGGLGPNLTDAKWLHSDGSFEALVKQITTGVPANQSTTGVVMPPKGGSSLSDPQIRAVAAYVWSLSHTNP